MQSERNQSMSNPITSLPGRRDDDEVNFRKEREREKEREDKPEAEARTVDLVPVDDVFIAFDELFINI